MKKATILILILLAVGLVFTLVVTGSSQNKKKTEAAVTESVQKTCDCGHVMGSAECKKAHAEGTCKCSGSVKCACTGTGCASEKCADPSKCAETHAAGNGSQDKAGCAAGMGSHAAGQCADCKHNEGK